MKQYEVWIESSKGATKFLGNYKGYSFGAACLSYISANSLPIDRYDEEKNSYSGFRFYDNES